MCVKQLPNEGKITACIVLKKTIIPVSRHKLPLRLHLSSLGSPSRLRLHHVWGVTILVLAVAVRNIKIVTGKDFNILFVLVTMKAVPAKESPFL